MKNEAKRSDEEQRALHARLARRPGVKEKIAEATAMYEKMLAAGELGRTPASKRNAPTRKR